VFGDSNSESSRLSNKLMLDNVRVVQMSINHITATYAKLCVFGSLTRTVLANPALSLGCAA
jgi:hypothetical protein